MENKTPHELVLVNRFPVAREQVWAAWTEPAKFAQWWVGPGWRTHDVVLETTAGGRFGTVQTAEDGSMTIPFDGTYTEVVDGERLVWGLQESPGGPVKSVLTVQLRDAEGGCEQEFRQTGVVTDEHFEALKAGTKIFFGQLEEWLAKQ